MKFLLLTNFITADAKSIQLLNSKGQSSSSGLVVLNTQKGEGTINGKNADDRTAELICQALGYNYGARESTCEDFEGCNICGYKNVPVLGALDCSDSEEFKDCQLISPKEDESHSNDLVITCTSSTIQDSIEVGSLRLIDSFEAPSLDSAGRLEIYDGKKFTTVSSASWTARSTQVACQQMGYSGSDPSVFHCSNVKGENLCGSKSPEYDAIECRGDEPRLLDCAVKKTDFSVPEENVVIQCTGQGDSTGVGQVNFEKLPQLFI